MTYVSKLKKMKTKEDIKQRFSDLLEELELVAQEIATRDDNSMAVDYIDNMINTGHIHVQPNIEHFMKNN